jgi:hypothetical protein
VYETERSVAFHEAMLCLVSVLEKMEEVPTVGFVMEPFNPWVIAVLCAVT